MRLAPFFTLKDIKWYIVCWFKFYHWLWLKSWVFNCHRLKNSFQIFFYLKTPKKHFKDFNKSIFDPKSSFNQLKNKKSTCIKKTIETQPMFSNNLKSKKNLSEISLIKWISSILRSIFFIVGTWKLTIFFLFSSFPNTFSLKPCNKKLKKKWNLDVNWEGSQKKLGGPKCIFFCHIVISHMVFLCFSLVLFYLKCISQLENLKSISLKSILKSGKKIFKSLWEPNTKRLLAYKIHKISNKMMQSRREKVW